MLSNENINQLKKDGMTFEEVNELNSRLTSINDGTAEFVDEKNFWTGVKADIVNFHKNKSQKCIK